MRGNQRIYVNHRKKSRETEYYGGFVRGKEGETSRDIQTRPRSKRGKGFKIIWIKGNQMLLPNVMVTRPVGEHPLFIKKYSQTP